MFTRKAIKETRQNPIVWVYYRPETIIYRATKPPKLYESVTKVDKETRKTEEAKDDDEKNFGDKNDEIPTNQKCAR